MAVGNVNSESINYECCLCGDVGIQKELFQCQICLNRLQHRYCSRLYVNSHRTALVEWICEWCLHEREDQKSKTEVGSALNCLSKLIDSTQRIPENPDLPKRNAKQPKCRYRSLATLL